MGNFIVPIKPMTLSFDKPEANVAAGGGKPFQDILNQVTTELQTASEVSEQNGVDLALGNIDNLPKLQIDSMKAQMMLQTTVQLTTRMVNAYKEIMQMSV